VSASFPSAVIDKPVIFYGTGEVAEIGYICLQDFDLRLVGDIDDCGKDRFFGVPLFSTAQTAQLSKEHSDATVVVMTIGNREDVLLLLDSVGVSVGGVFWV
jgi:hypothetical protein